MRKIITLEAGKNKKPNICGYVRVSSESHTQEASFEAQMREWYKRFGKDERYNLVGVFGDLAVSGHKVKEREDFQEMIDLALRGKIDIIVTKSIARFARNTVESQKVLRQLKEADVEVIFDKENLSTKKFGTEFFIVILTIVAEMELRNMSEAVKFGYRFRSRNGSVEVTSITGYEIDDDDNWTINEEQADNVRRIFALYLSGLGMNAIAQQLESEGRIAYKGGTRWSCATIRGILENEKYIGDAKSQKYYSDENFKTRINKGELPHVYIENNHEAIISREDFAKAQELMAAKKTQTSEWHKDRPAYDFTSKIQCICCGKNFRRRVNTSCRRVSPISWMCSTQFLRGKKTCEATSIAEGFLQDLLVDAYNEYIKTPYKAPMRQEDSDRIDEIEKEEAWVRQIYNDRFIDYTKYAAKIKQLQEEHAEARQKAKESLKNQYYEKHGKKADRYDPSIVENHIERIRVGLFEAEFEFKNGQVIKRRFKYGNRTFRKENDQDNPRPYQRTA